MYRPRAGVTATITPRKRRISAMLMPVTASDLFRLQHGPHQVVEETDRDDEAQNVFPSHDSSSDPVRPLRVADRRVEERGRQQEEDSVHHRTTFQADRDACGGSG